MQRTCLRNGIGSDFRAVFNEVATAHLKIKDNEKLFPEWKGSSIGLIKT